MTVSFQPYLLARFLLSSHKRCGTAVDALLFLAARPGKVWQAMDLSLAVDNGPLEVSHTLLDTRAIPVCDARALREYRARIAKLASIRAQLLETESEPDLTEIDWELRWLRAEIRRSLLFRGKIRGTNTARKHAWLRLRNAFTRLIARAQKDSPALAAYLRDNLSTSHGFAWLGEEIRLPEAAPQPKQNSRAA